ncbi:MAG: response regulator [Planctomycetia bacterium]|nr:response regulator [Planctomycetia bacterium]
MNMQLLLCESNESSLGELRDYLTGRGFDVEVASNGLQCLLLLREMRPDIVVLNWELPWGGGDGVLSVLQEEFRLLPVVISTRNLSTVSRTLRYDGIVELIGRPLRPKEVYSGILNALRRSENLCETIPDTQPVGATGKL